MPATAATFQINTAAAAESSEEGFLAVIRLAENLSRVNTHQNGRDNLQSSKLEIRNSKQIQMTKLKENSKRASLDAVFWIFPFEIYSTRMFVSISIFGFGILFPGAFSGRIILNRSQLCRNIDKFKYTATTLNQEKRAMRRLNRLSSPPSFIHNQTLRRSPSIDDIELKGSAWLNPCC